MNMARGVSQVLQGLCASKPPPTQYRVPTSCTPWLHSCVIRQRAALLLGITQHLPPAAACLPTCLSPLMCLTLRANCW